MKIKDVCTYAPRSNIKAGDATIDGQYMFFTSSEDESKRYGEYQFDGEGIIMGTGGNATLHYYNGKFAVSTDCVVLLPDDRLRCKYLYYFFLANLSLLEAGFKGAGLKHTNKGYIGNIDIEIPPLEEQDCIVNVLDYVFKIRRSRSKELASLDKLIKARFVEMFGHQSHNEQGLPYMTVEDVAEIYLGITHTPEYVDEGVTFISAKNTSGDFLDLSDVKHISREEFETAPIGSKPQKNDVLFSRVGSNLGHPVILEDDIELCTFVSLGFLRTKGLVTSNYLKHWMRDEYFTLQVAEHVKGGGQPNLNTGWLKQFKIIVPDMETQIEFDEFCQQVDKSKFVVQKALEKAQLLFDSLMQEYFG